MAAASAEDSVIVSTRYGTDDAAAAHEYLANRYAGHTVLSYGGPLETFRFGHTGRVAGRIGMAQLRHSAGFTATSDPLDYLLFAAISTGGVELSTGRDQLRVGRGDAFVYPLATRFAVSWGHLAVHHMLALPWSAVVATAAAQTGIAPDDLRFEAMTPVSPAMTRYWRSTVGMVNRELSAPDSALGSPLVQAATVSMLAVAALSSFPNTAMTAAQLPGPGRVAPAALRRAVAYIDSHADQPITVADIAGAAGVGARAVQHAFKQHHDTTPLGYLAQVRLERAHRDLQAGDPTRGDTVTAIAHRWGFTNTGRFATRYRRTYGQHPHHTLRT